MNNLPVVIKNFITSDEADNYVHFIESNKDSFPQGSSPLRRVIMFGNGPAYRENYRDTSELSTITANIKSLLERIKIAACTTYGERELYPSLLWLSVQEPGGSLPLHTDTGDGLDVTRIYAALLYLNDQDPSGDGHLNFPNLNYTYVPCQGDLVLFPTLDDDETYLHGVDSISSTRYTILSSLITDPTLEITIDDVQ